MKTKQIIIALCLIAGFGLLVFIWQRSKTEPEQTSIKPEQTPVAVNANSAADNLNSATATPAGTPAPPMDLNGVKIGGAQTPTEAYKMLFTAVKAKDTEAIKRMISQKTQVFAEGVAAQQNTPLPKFLENGITATTFAPSLPKIRDQRIKDDMGAIEVWNERDKKWEDLPFVKETDGWKLGVGDIFMGTYQSPGKGQAQIEAEKSNTNTIPMGTNPAANSSNSIVPRTSNK